VSFARFRPLRSSGPVRFRAGLAGSAAALLGAATLVAAAGPAAAVGTALAPGGLDPSFDNAGQTPGVEQVSAGQIVAGATGSNVAGNAVATQSNGDVVVVGTVSAAGNGQPSLAVTRYLPNGAIDPTFGTNGTFFLTEAQTGILGTAVTVLPGGDIVAAAQVEENYASTTASPVQKYLLVELTSTGALNPSFGSGGEVLDPSNAYSFNDEFNSLAVQANGDIVGAGDNDNGWLVARFSATGVLDTSFASSGYYTADPAGSFLDNANAVQIDPSGNIVVAGSGYDQSGLAVVRLTSTGSLDSSFNGTGMATAQPGVPGAAGDGFGLVLQPEGGSAYDPVVTGTITVPGGGTDLVVWQLNQAGQTQQTITESRSGEKLEGGRAVIESDPSLASNGDIIVAGYENNGSSSDATVLYRFLPNLSLDPSWGSGGVDVVPIDATQTLGGSAVEGDATSGLALEPGSVDTGVGAVVTTGDVITSGTQWEDVARFVESAESSPTIAVGASNQTVKAGDTVTFTASASGSPTPSVQWQVSTDNGNTWTPIPGATSDSLSFVASASQNGYQYEAVFTNSVGSVTTSPVTLTVETAPSITTNPSSVTAQAGAQASFTAAATGNPAPTVQWQVSSDGGTTWSPISGATNPTLSFTAAAGDNGDQYEAVFTNSVGTVTTAAATLTVESAPAILSNPTDQQVIAGASATFTATASGNPGPTVQWQVSTNGGTTWSPVPGATSDTLTISTTSSDNGNEYEAVFTNSVGTATSGVAVLMVETGPQVTTNPANVKASKGATVSFSAAASGTPTPTVQWYVSTNKGASFSPITGATSTKLSFTAATTENGYEYEAVFTNGAGTATTTPATLTVSGSSSSSPASPSSPSSPPKPASPSSPGSPGSGPSAATLNQPIPRQIEHMD
jgi:uncharacterized delta-60 repeat protein